MKRICIISDIHGNMSALEMLLEYIDKNYDVEYILNLGDFLQKGPNQCEVFDIVMKDSRFINIMGNSEYELIYEDLGEGWIDDGEITHETWVRQELGEARINVLRELPLSKSVEVYGKKIFMMHANRESGLEMPFEYHLQGVLTKCPLEQLSSTDLAMTTQEHDYLLVANNHIQEIQQYKFFEDRCYSFIQPGAIGCLDMGDVRFAVLEIGEFEENITFKTLKYDAYKVIEECKEKKVADPCHGIYLNKIKQDKAYYDVHLENKSATDVIPMDFSFWEGLVTPYLETNKYIEFGIWNSDEDLFEELKTKLHILNVEYMKETKQIFIKAEIDETVKQLVINNNLNSEGLIKWFNVSIDREEDKCAMYASHFGCEIDLINVAKKEVEYLKSIINPKKNRLSLY